MGASPDSVATSVSGGKQKTSGGTILKSFFFVSGGFGSGLNTGGISSVSGSSGFFFFGLPFPPPVVEVLAGGPPKPSSKSLFDVSLIIFPSLFLSPPSLTSSLPLGSIRLVGLFLAYLLMFVSPP